MGEKKRKKHPEKSPQANKKEASIHDDLPQKSNFSVAVSHAFSSGWVQNSTIAFLGTLIWLVVAMATNTQIKAAAITFGLMGTAALWILAFAVIRYSSESKEPELVFSLLFKNFDGSRKPTSGVFWFRYPSGYGDTLSPVSAALYMTVKNPRISPAYIERLEIDVQEQGKRWLSLRHIPAEGGRLYWIYGNITKAGLLNMPTLDQRIHSSIPPGETITGWIFWAVTEEYPVSEGDKIRWRIRAKDSGGEKSEYISPYEVITNKPAFDTAMSQPVPMVVTGITEDLSKLVIRNFEPLPYE